MNHKTAKENIDIISALLREWSESGNISKLDYDLLTDKIKGLYEAVKFATPDNPQPKYDSASSQAIDNNTVASLYGDREHSITGSHNKNNSLSEDHKKVLGDVIRPCGETIADRLGSPVKDMATVIGNEKINSLRSAIGLNDRYIIVRDLFGGDMDAFEVAIMHLDEFTSIDDAILYIHDTYGWNRENEAARMISDMLVRKLM